MQGKLKTYLVCSVLSIMAFILMGCPIKRGDVEVEVLDQWREDGSICACIEVSGVKGNAHERVSLTTSIAGDAKITHFSVRNGKYKICGGLLHDWKYVSASLILSDEDPEKPYIPPLPKDNDPENKKKREHYQKKMKAKDWVQGFFINNVKITDIKNAPSNSDCKNLEPEKPESD